MITGSLLIHRLPRFPKGKAPCLEQGVFGEKKPSSWDSWLDSSQGGAPPSEKQRGLGEASCQRLGREVTPERYTGRVEDSGVFSRGRARRVGK